MDNIIFGLQKSGGISVVWYNLLDRLLSDPDFDIHFLDYPSKNIFRQKLIIQKVKIHNDLLTSLPINLQRFINPKITNNYNLFHSSYYRINRFSKAVNITTVHDFTYEYFRKGFSMQLHHIQKGYAIEKSKRIICVSKNTKEDLLKIFPKIKQDHIKVIYNGVDDVYRPLNINNELTLKKNIPFSSREFVLYVGDRKSAYKNFELAVGACKIACMPLVMVGGGLLTSIENHFLNARLGPNKFSHLNGISNELLNVIYNHAFCLLYPSLYEGFGIPILEAQKAGCVVITTNRSSIPEVAGKGAILVNEIKDNYIADLLKQLMKSSVSISNLQKEGFINSQRFSWDQCYKETKQLYKSVNDEFSM